MVSSRATARHVRPRRRRNRFSRRSGRLAVLGLVALAVLIVLLVAAFSSSAPPFQQSLPKGSRANPNSPPSTMIVAREGTLNVQLPISQGAVTALGYHGTDGDSVPLEPIGRQANEGVLPAMVHWLFGGGSQGPTYYELGGAGPGTGALDVGAAQGTDVYSPVDGTVVSIGTYVLDGKAYGNTLEIQPTEDASVVVVVTRLSADPSLTVGESVSAGLSKIGSVIDLSTVEKQTLASVSHDAGNHVTIEVDPAPSLPVR
jgi:murein DD-endopeptidase MepM/ murein hydrolase activator NlpD